MQGIFIILVPIIVAICLWVICAVLDDNAGSHNNSELGIFCGYLGGITTVVATLLFIFWGTQVVTTRTTVNEMVSFYESNQYNYRYAVENTEDVNIVAAEPGLIDVAYLEQGKLTGVRILEFRDQVNWYNNTLRDYRDKNTHWFLGAFYHNPPDYLKPIVLTE